MRFLVLSTSLNPKSRSRRLAEAARTHFEAEGHEVDYLDLRDHPLPLCDGGAAYGAPQVQEVTARLVAADGILCAVPIYTFNVSAAFKNLIELTGRGAWADKVAAFMCAAGGKSSYMSVMGIAASLMLDFRTVVVPRFVYADASCFGEDGSLQDDEVRGRVGNVALDLVRFTTALREG